MIDFRTLITMSNGQKKRVDQLSVGEEIVTFDHVNGKISIAPVAYIFQSYINADIIKLSFANGTDITILQGHCFYDQEENKYIEINKNNVQEYVGHKFFCMDTMSFVELVSYKYSNDYIEAYKHI